MLLMGIIFANVGLDPISGLERFTFGVVSLQGGFDFVTWPWGYSDSVEILLTLEEKQGAEFVDPYHRQTFSHSQ